MHEISTYLVEQRMQNVTLLK